MLRLIHRMSQTLFCCVCHLPQPGVSFPKALDTRSQRLGPEALHPAPLPSHNPSPTQIDGLQGRLVRPEEGPRGGPSFKYQPLGWAERWRQTDADLGGKRSWLESQLQAKGMLSSQSPPPPIPSSFYLHFNKCCPIMHCGPRRRGCSMNKTKSPNPGGQSGLGLSFPVCGMGHPSPPGPLHRQFWGFLEAVDVVRVGSSGNKT